MDVPETRYAKAADGTRVAYQVFGHGMRDIVFLPGQISHLDLHWEEPAFAELMGEMG